MRLDPDPETVTAAVLARIGRSASPPDPIRRRIHARMPHATAIVAPDSADAIADILALCAAEGWAVRPAGAGTGTTTDPRPVVVVSTARLSGITEHEPADLVVGALSGTPLDQLQPGLREQGQWLPLDPPRQSASVGSILARRAAGPLRAGHGTPRDMTLGLELVTGDGRRLRFGGRVVKNVAGYDVVRLVVGSGGRLGIITHAFLRLRGTPRQERSLLMPADDAIGATALALRVRDQVQCDALELLSPAAAGKERWLVAVRLLGTEAAVGAAVQRLTALCDEAAPAPAGWWDRLAAREAAAPSRTRVVRPSQIAGVLASVPPDSAVAVHVTDGVIRIWGGSPDTGSRLLETQPRIELLTRQICAMFDPAGILQPPDPA